ncbi:MAG TPA: rod shape-determining protein RodA [Thiotrichales bacterium]|nr:rod shape-determining protein RodA [Thiotrichales bacterium]
MASIAPSPFRRESGALTLDALFRRIHLDLPLLLGVTALAAVGLFVLYSASGESLESITRQGIRMGISFVVMLVLAQIHPHTLKRWTPAFYLGIVILLIAVLVMGEIGKGAQRWLDLGVVRFQPSELMKLALPMMIAWYLSETPLPPSRRKLLASALLIALPAGMIAKQPDLGTSLLVASSGLFVLFLAGLSWRLIAGFVVSVALAVWPVWKFLMHDYQRTRVITFLNPESDPLGSGYHIIQSKIAVGSGGLYGKGWLNGTQSQLDFLPERSTDFIFAVFAEEFGFLGAVLLLLLYLAVITRGLYIAVQAQESYGRLLAGSLALTLFVYVFVNIGMVTGLLPVVGLPLPMISYGGTSMVTLGAGFGILMSIHTHRRLLSS